MYLVTDTYIERRFFQTPPSLIYEEGDDEDNMYALRVLPQEVALLRTQLSEWVRQLSEMEKHLSP